MHSVHQIEALSKIVEIIAFRSEEQKMLVDILDVLDSKLRMQRGTIMLLAPNTMELAVEAVPSRTSSVNPMAKYRVGEGIMGKVVETGKSAVVPRISEEPLFRDRIHKRRDSNTDDGAFICIPVKIGNDILGVLAVDLAGCDEPLELTEAERLLNIVGSMIAHSVKARHAARQELEALEQENNRLRDALGESFRPESIIGNSLTMRDVYLRLHQVSRADTTVLIRGESGTGKELIEHAVIVLSDGVIHGGDLPPTLQIPSTGEIKGSGKLIQRVESLEKEMIVDALKHADGNKTLAAADLGVSLRILRYKIKQLGIDCSQYFNYPRKSKGL